MRRVPGCRGVVDEGAGAPVVTCGVDVQKQGAIGVERRNLGRLHVSYVNGACQGRDLEFPSPQARPNWFNATLSIHGAQRLWAVHASRDDRIREADPSDQMQQERRGKKRQIASNNHRVLRWRSHQRRVHATQGTGPRYKIRTHAQARRTEPVRVIRDDQNMLSDVPQRRQLAIKDPLPADGEGPLVDTAQALCPSARNDGRRPHTRLRWVNQSCPNTYRQP